MANVDRRDFLKLVGVGGASVGAGFMLRESTKHPVEYLVPYSIPPEEFSAGIATWYNTVCSMCSAGCGISVRTREGRAKKIEGNPAHPVSQGRLCALGQAGLQVLYNPDRLIAPLERAGERGSGSFAQTTWEQAQTQAVEKLSALRASGQGDRVGFLSAGVRGHLAHLFELFMAELGSDRLLHYDFDHPQTLYAANKRLFDQDQLPYYDIGNSSFLLSFGADFLGSWISPVHHALGFGRSRQGREHLRGRFVQVEPRMSLSGAAADQWIAARPGTEGILALGLAHHIVGHGGYSGADSDDWEASLARYTPAWVAEQTGVSQSIITGLAEAFASTQPALAIGGGAAGNHGNGVDTLVAVHALNYLVGNLGKAGGLVFNSQAAVGPSSPSRQASYRQMEQLATDAREGRIEVLIVNGTNPVFSLPEAAGFKEALAEIPFIISLSSFMDETTALADLVLPSHTYLESWGDDAPEPGVGFPIGAISQPVVSPLYNTRATGDIVLGIAHELGLNTALPWTSMEDYLKDSWRKIHSGGPLEVQTESFDSFWTAVLKSGVWGEKRDRDPTTITLDRSVIDAIDVTAAEFSGATDTYPYVLHLYLSNSLHDGRGANLPWMQEFPDPMTSVVYGSWVEINPVTAKELGLSEGDLVDVESPHGSVRAPVFVYPAIMPDVIAMPIGQGHGDYGRYARNRGANPINILSPQVEPDTGSLAWSATRVKLNPTGLRVDLVKTGGVARELGREIVQTTGSTTNAGHSAGLASIPIKEVSS